MSTFFTAESPDELSQLQRAFFAIISSELEDGDRIIPDSRIPDLISPNEKLSAMERIEIYARQYWWRLLQSLEEDFPVLKNILGVEKFNAILKKYICACPSQSYTLRHLGRKLPDFIKNSADTDLTGNIRILATDVATFELYQSESFFAADGNTFNETDLQSQDPEKLFFSLQPHVFPLKLSHPLHEYYHSFKKSSMRDNETNAFPGVSIDEEEARLQIPVKESLVVLYRYGTQVFAKETDEFEFEFLTYLSSPHTLSDILSNFLNMNARKMTETEIFNLFKKSTELHWIHSSSIMGEGII